VPSIIPRAQIPQSQINNLPNVRAPEAPDLRPLVEGAQVVNRGVQNILGQIQERNDTTALLQARRELSEFEAEAFNPNNPEGIAKYRGGNALGAGELVTKADTRIGEIRSRLNPRQAAQFDAVSFNFRDQMAGRLNTYMDREHSQFLAAEQKAAIDNLGNDAVSAGLSGDFARQDQVATELLAMDRRRLEVDGAGPEVIKASQQGIASNIRAQTIQGMAASRPFEALAYYERYADQMLPGDRMRVEAVLQPIVVDANADALADAAISGRDITGSADVDAMIEQMEGTGQNPNSSARGVGQFVDATWLETIKKHRPDLAEGKSNAELLTLKDDPQLGRELLTKFREDNARSLTARGITPNAENLYAAHHFGVGGGARFARASNDTPMTSILSPKEIAANPYLKGKTVGEVKSNWARRGLRVAAVSDGQSEIGMPRTEADALAALDNAGLDPQTRRAAKAKVREKWAIADAQKAEREKAISQNAYTALTANTDPRATLPQIIGPEAYALFASKGQVDSLQNYRKNILSGTLVQDNPVLADALQREAVLNPNAFKKRNLYANANELSTDTLQGLLKMQAEVDKPDKQTEWATTNERIDQGYLLLNIAPSGDTKSNGEKRQNERAAFAAQYRAAERDFVQRNKRQPTQAEADTLLRSITRAAAQRQVDGTLTPDRLGSSFVASISESTRAEIRANVREDLNREPTEAEIIAAAAAFAQRGSQ
jgi:hypothetical protein